MHTDTDTASTLRLLIHEIRDLYHELPETIAHIAGLHAIAYSPTQARSNDTQITGGDAIVLHAPGTDNTVKSAQNGNRDHAADNHPNDPPSVLAVLTRIEDTWRLEQNVPAATTTTTKAAATYLIANANWAALNHPHLEHDLTDLQALRGRLRNVTGKTDHPKPSDAPCNNCNGRIVQRYTKDGLDDDRECHRCGTTYTPNQYEQAIEQRLQTVREDMDRTLTANQARTLWGLSEKQIYVWEEREKIAHIGRNTNGHRLYKNSDIATLRDPKKE